MAARTARSLVAAAAATCVLSGAALSQTSVRLGELEAQTGAINTFGWMSSQGTRLAVDEINKAGGFEVGGKKYVFDLHQVDTRGEPREATVQFRKMMEEKIPYVFGPFLSNVFNAIRPIAEQNDGKFLMLGGGTSLHDALGKPNTSFLMRTWNWDAGPQGFGTLMVQYIKKLGARKVAMLFQNDAAGRVAVDIYKRIFSDADIELSVDMFEPGTKDFTSSLAKIAATNLTICFQGTLMQFFTTSFVSRSKAVMARSSLLCAARLVQRSRIRTRSTTTSPTYRNTSSWPRRPSRR